MINLSFIKNLLLGSQQPVPNISVGQYDDLPSDGLTMGTLIVGRQGTGKTSFLARHLVDYFKYYPTRAIFVLDWSGSISNAIIKLILQERDKDQLLRRVVYDEMGHPEWVIPLPEFSGVYGPYEEQVQRVSLNLVRLAPELVEGAPFLAGLGLREIAPHIFRLLTAITNDHGESWQITEVKKLLVDSELLKNAIANYGHKVPEAKWFLENVFLKWRASERELRTYALLSLLGAVEPSSTRARLGYFRPGWTPKEAIDKGLMVLVNGARLINERNTQHHLFTQADSLIMEEINKRQPGNPADEPIALVMDEVYSLLSIPGMAEEVGMLSPLYRSRKMELYVVLQALSQLAPILKQQIWSIGNVVCFGVSNFDEAYEIAQQIFKYDPSQEKQISTGPHQKSVLETDRGQYLTCANWIQRLKHRECIIKRYWNERKLDMNVRLVPMTRNQPPDLPAERLTEIKEQLLRERGVLVREALEVINQRKLTAARPIRPPSV